MNRAAFFGQEKAAGTSVRGRMREKRCIMHACPPEVDAVMMSRVSVQLSRPIGTTCGWLATGTRDLPRTFTTADTNQPPPGGERSRRVIALRSGKTAFVKRSARHFAAGSVRADNMNRAQFPGSIPRPRGWRYLNDNAHADRCAPPGRNPGGGAQGQSD
jgi:hypothetical protein